MTRDRTIFDRRRPFADGYGILDLAEPVSFHAGVPGSADRAPRPQVLKKLLSQHAARLNEQAAIRTTASRAIGPSGEGEGKSLQLMGAAHRHGPSRANTQFKI